MLFFQIQEAFLFLPKIFFQFSAQNFFWIDQVLSKMNVRKEETIFRLESKSLVENLVFIILWVVISPFLTKMRTTSLASNFGFL